MNDRRNLLQESLTAIERLQSRLDASERAKHEPIAIIGVGCRYPGGVQTLDDFWRVLRDGVNAVSDVPPDRWDAAAYYDPDPQAPGKMITRRGGFLTQVDAFDAQFFGISPREAATMDPQQRLLLETATEALETAGLATDRLAGSATGVFVGITTSDYGQLLRLGGPEHSDVYSATGSALNAAAGRVSFTYGFQGPCVAVDTACSSSLVAVHLACQSLRAGESDLALAGGVNVILSPDAMVLFSKWGMMAPDGACKTFDAAADGFVRAEGCAVIALKRLADAQAAGDPILAVIRGSAVNSDGRSSGLTVPNGPAQQAVLRRALASANLNPADIDYVEAHGTGTPLGDPIEIEALGTVMRSGRSPDRPLKIGSVKTNFGHTEAASGLAGLLKVVMALRHEAIPPHLHFSTPNPGIPWADLPLSVPTTLTPWVRTERTRRAGVSSFGFSGTNAHVIVEEAPSAPEMPPAIDEPRVIVLSARNDAALRAVARRTAGYLDDQPTMRLGDLAATLATGRTHYEKRLAFVADSLEHVRSTLTGIADGDRPAGVVEGALRIGERPKIAFLFTGQGAQYAGMSRSLYESEPVFRNALDACAAILSSHLDRSLFDVLFAQESESVIGQTAYTQPALFAVEYALAELWRSWGITPSIVAGHSVGEYVAACVAGVFTLEDGLALIAERGRLMQALPAGGAMAAVFAAEAEVTSRVAAVAGRLSVAAVNGPEETVVSGDAGAVQALLERCAADGIKGRALDVSHAFHSARLDPMLDAFEQRAGRIAYRVPRIPLVSNLTGAVFPAGTCPDARYWRRHAREAVRFSACIETLNASRAAILLEVGPHPTLLGLASRAAPGATWTATASLRRGRDERREMLTSAGALHVRGAAVNWEAVMAGRQDRRALLPTYPFQRERHWIEKSSTPRHSAAGSGHPLLGTHLALATGGHVWEQEISLDTHPWVRDHRVQGAPILPATAYIEMALQMGKEALGDGSLSVSEIEVSKPMILHENRSRVVQATLQIGGDGARMAVHSRPAGDRPGMTGASLQWTVHATARVTAIESPPAAARDGIDAARARCDRALDGEHFYSALAKKGNQWGPCFQGMDRVWSGDGEAIGLVRVVPALNGDTARYRFHPAVSDACGHALVATVPSDRNDSATGGAFVGGGVSEIRFYRSPIGGTLWSHAVQRPNVDGPQNAVVGDVEVYDESGALVSETIGARLWYLDERTGSELLGVPDDWYYQVSWQSHPLPGDGTRQPKDGPWVIFADQSGVAEHIASSRRAAGLATHLVTRGSAWTASADRVTIRASEADDYVRLMSSIEKPSVVVHLWSLDTTRIDAAGDPLATGLALGPESVLHLLHGIRQAANGSRPRIWLVTAGAQSVSRADVCQAPWNGTLWGMGKSLSAEHSELWGGLVDLPADGVNDRDVSRLVAEIEAGTADDEVALRAEGRYVPRLEHRSAIRHDATMSLVRPDATYLLTGGLGGVGLAMAGWLAEKGAKHLLLLGRAGLPPRDEWHRLDLTTPAGRRAAALMSIESRGTSVETRAVDVADAAALQSCLDEWVRSGHPPVRGVIHAAGVLHFQPLESQDVASLRACLAGKVGGAWHLHRLLGRQLDFFVFCSSTSALLNSPLLGGYAAANAFLDALAWHRRGMGLPALSVNWGTWGEIGMAVESGRGADMLSGVGTIPTGKGLAALGELLDSGDVQAALMPVDWQKFAGAYPAFAADPFFADLIDSVPPSAHAERAAGLSLALLRDAAADARSELLGTYLRAETARVLGLAPDRLDPTIPLSSFGFDSLMAVQLKNRIEVDLYAVLPMIEFLQGPSVDELSATLLLTVDLTASGAELAAHVAEETWEEGSL